MSTTKEQGPGLKDALNQCWPIAGSELFSSKKSANHLDNAKFLWLLLQDAFNNQRISLSLPTLPQLHQLDAALSLNHQILNRLAFIDLYYQQLAQHAYLDSETLQLLYQLRPALLRSLLHSDNVLVNSRHPLRILIEDICQWGIGWDSHVGKNGEKYFAALNDLVAIGNNLPGDCRELPDTYAVVLGNLGSMATRYRQLELRICENEQATMDNLAIQRHIEIIINECVEGKPLPTAAIIFLHGVWRDILHRLRILHKTDDPEWKEALRLMDALVFCLSPQPGSKQEQINVIPGLIQSLKRLLQKSGYDAGNTHPFDDVVSIFKQIMMKEEIPMQLAPSLSNLNIGGVPTTVSSSIAQQIIELETGQWILYKAPNGEMVRGRIARFFADAGHVLLVNLLGAKPLTKSVEELGLALNTKRAHLLVAKNLSHTILSFTIDLFIRNYCKAMPQTASSTIDPFRKKSADKALAEAQKLREIVQEKPVVVPLHESQGSHIEAMVHDLKIGSWLSMKNRLGEQMPCKVSVIYASSGKMVITDKSGLPVGEYQRQELVKLIMQGEVRIIKLADSFEDSLSKVLKTLRKSP